MMSTRPANIISRILFFYCPGQTHDRSEFYPERPNSRVPWLPGDNHRGTLAWSVFFHHRVRPCTVAPQRSPSYRQGRPRDFVLGFTSAGLTQVDLQRPARACHHGLTATCIPSPNLKTSQPAATCRGLGRLFTFLSPLGGHVHGILHPFLTEVDDLLAFERRLLCIILPSVLHSIAYQASRAGQGQPLSCHTVAVAAPELVSPPAHLPHFQYPGPPSQDALSGRLPEIVASFSNSRRRLGHPEPDFSPKAGGIPRCAGTRELRPTPDEASMSEGGSKPRPPTVPPGHIKNDSSSSFPSRTLPSIQDAVHTSSAHENLQRSTAVASPSVWSQTITSTPPDQRGSRPIGFQNILNPAGQDAANPQTQRGPGNRTESPPTPSSLGPNSRGATPAISTTSGQTRSSVDASIPQVTPPNVSSFPVPLGRVMTPHSPSMWPRGKITKGLPTGTIDARQTPFIMARDETTTSNGPTLHSLSEVTQGMPLPGRPRGHGAIQGPAVSRQSSQESNYQSWSTFERPPAGPGMQAPSSHQRKASNPSFMFGQSSHQEPNAGPAPAGPGQPQSFFPSAFTATGPTPTIPQTGLNRGKGFNLSTSGAMNHSSIRVMTLETEHGPIQVPVDVEAASKVADEKRKRNATASHRFRQRRKEKERETSENIARLEAQIRDVSEEKDHYQKERDFLQDFILRHRIPLPNRPPSPRRHRHITRSGPMLSQYPDSDPDDRSGRQTRRRTSAYAPPTSAAPIPAETPNLHQYDRISAMPSEHMQQGGQIRPVGSYPPIGGPFSQPPPAR